MVAVRQRQRLSTFTGYRTHKNTHVTNSSTYISDDEFTEDVTGRGDNFNFTNEVVEQSGGLINGTQQSNLTGYIWDDYPADYFKIDAWRHSHLAIPGPPSDGQLAAQLLSRTNPSRTSIEAMEHLWEIGQLPGLIKSEWGRRMERMFRSIGGSRNFRFAKRAAKLQLILQFGLLPLLGDISKLAQFQDLVDQRVRELERLKTRGLRRTVDLWGDVAKATDVNRLIHSNGVSLRCTIDKITSLQCRGHVRWYTSENFDTTDPAFRSRVRKTISGYRLDPAALYELMPWSWLIDYFTNLGSIIKASRNSFSAHHEPVRIMRHTTTYTNTNSHTTSGSGQYVITCSPFHAKRETKWRRQAVGSLLGARIEFLNGTQASILGALSIRKLL
jgi:hypothetical protein